MKRLLGSGKEDDGTVTKPRRQCSKMYDLGEGNLEPRWSRTFNCLEVSYPVTVVSLELQLEVKQEELLRIEMI